MTDPDELSNLLDRLNRVRSRIIKTADRPQAAGPAIAEPLSQTIQASRVLEGVLAGGTVTAEQRYTAGLVIELARQAGELAGTAIHGRYKPLKPGQPTTTEELAAIADRCHWLAITGIDPAQANLIYADRTFA